MCGTTRRPAERSRRHRPAHTPRRARERTQAPTTEQWGRARHCRPRSDRTSADQSGRVVSPPPHRERRGEKPRSAQLDRGTHSFEGRATRCVARTPTMRSTGETMRCTSIGAVTPCLRSALHTCKATTAAAVSVIAKQTFSSGSHTARNRCLARVTTPRARFLVSQHHCGSERNKPWKNPRQICERSRPTFIARRIDAPSGRW